MSIKSIIMAVIVFLCLDALWIGMISRQLYIDQIGHLLHLENGNIQVNFLAAVIVYCFLILGLCLFVLPKAQGNPLFALGWGALFGMICYGTYDFTNLAVMSQWPFWLSVIDVIWGVLICSVTSFILIYFK